MAAPTTSVLPSCPRSANDTYRLGPRLRGRPDPLPPALHRGAAASSCLVRSLPVGCSPRPGAAPCS